jgi:hypothetical protein
VIGSYHGGSSGGPVLNANDREVNEIVRGINELNRATIFIARHAHFNAPGRDSIGLNVTINTR